MARPKGLRDSAVRRRHAVPNALLPVVSLSALNFGFVLSGAIAVEAIYSWPGIGQATLEAIRGPDFPMLQGLFLLSRRGSDHPQPRRRPDPRLARPADRWERMSGEGVPTTVVVSPRSLVRCGVRRRHPRLRVCVPPRRTGDDRCRRARGVRPDGVAGAGDQPAGRPQRRRLDPQPGVGTSEPRLPVRHRQPRTIRRGPVRLGCTRQPVRRCGGNPADGRDRLDRGHRCRVLRRPCRLPVDARHRLVPRHPVPAPGNRPGRRARSIVAQRDHRHRHHVVAGDRPDHPRSGAHCEATAVRRPGQGARCRTMACRPPSRPAGGRPADPRQHDAGGADLDPHRDDAGVPRPR